MNKLKDYYYIAKLKVNCVDYEEGYYHYNYSDNFLTINISVDDGYFHCCVYILQKIVIDENLSSIDECINVIENKIYDLMSNLSLFIYCKHKAKILK